MRKIAVLTAAVLATACGTQKLTAEQVRAAMPASSVLEIKAPAAGASGAAPTGAPAGPQLSVAAAVAAPSPLAATSYLFAAAVNGGVFWALAPIAWLTTFVPPTSCTDTACTWGPGSNAGELNDWMLVVTRAGDGYDYTLSGKAKSPAGSPFVPVITGRAYPGTVEHRGHGTLHVDFDRAWAGLAHPAGELQKDFGSIAVDYDARTALHLDVTFLEARNGDHPGSDPVNPNRVNVAYAFDASATGGDLQLGFRTLAPYTDGAQEGTSKLHTRWQGGGAGVADASFTRPGASVAFSQCWEGGPAFAMTFDGTSSTLTDPSVCVFTPGAPITIAVP
jgi:hypothetical protein